MMWCWAILNSTGAGVRDGWEGCFISLRQTRTRAAINLSKESRGFKHQRAQRLKEGKWARLFLFLRGQTVSEGKWGTVSEG